MDLHAPGGLLHQTPSSEATCCPVTIGPSWGMCPGVGASLERNTPHVPLLSLLTAGQTWVRCSQSTE